MKLSLGSAFVSEVSRSCKQVMYQHRQSLSLVASNRTVVEEGFELNLDQTDSCVESLDQTKTFDAVVFDVLRVPAEDIANQLTLIDLPLFQNVGPEELTCCAWTAKKKHELCPNVVNFTKRFNQVSFWVQSEILASNTAKNRAEKIVHFIRIARKLLEINNLNSLKAVVSGLQSAPIYRLSKTWNVVPKRDKEKLEKLNELVSEDNNRTKIRTYLQNARLPCIPYLGMYLTDLTYINTIHPCTGGLDIERTEKMNEILRIIADFQQSRYDFEVVSHIRKYLSSVKYIDELQKFMEDDNYKLSLQIEPSAQQYNSERGTKESRSVSEFATESDELFPTNLRKSLPTKTMCTRPARLTPKSSSLNLPGPFRSPSPDKKQYIPSHRKVKSLGSHQQFLNSIQPHPSASSSLSTSSTGSRYHLVDDSLVDDNHSEVTTSNSYDSGLDHDEPETHPIIQSAEPKTDDILTPSMPWAYFKLQGFLKRKTLLKNGTRPKVASWQRFWVGITCSTANIVYFLPKYRGFGGHDRIHFKADPHKVIPLEGCTVFTCSEPDSFQLTDSGDNVYRFRSGSQVNANLWYEAIREAANCGKSNMPKNLITFDEDEDGNVTHL